MRDQDRSGLRLTPSWAAFGAALGGVCVLAFGAVSQEAARIEITPRLTGTSQPMSLDRVPPLGRPVTDDVRRKRNYPEQPPVIPHSIDGYQLTLNTNRCMDCHKREFTEGSGAPMISVTHFQDRDGQVLSDVTPRRYFCTACHVQQTDVTPLVPNLFQDARDIGRRP
ncbi:nitrate reductase cytochrome c-type subunit [Hansschlegelia zhihuaiae]|uniref:Periplasmic nitrate reductase, electron transfer subunit n=1 Tax=Hansschlegelia zhihuaiae TaxID=405005 RepID=A0A4Q0MCT0_9HYPH|nr:nitrate reductase cytochrome c-type subunit [Hansschlegelia zhihuaiae]RXF70903.1 nitrate reductase cytochrome c-type subunit [Hansschlegelia zhihuaiae]